MIEIMFQEISKHLIELGLGVMRKAQDGYLFHEGDAVLHLHFILEGRVELQRMQENGSPIILQRANAGCFLAEASLYASHYHCDAVVTAPSQLVRFSKTEVRRAFEADAQLFTLWASHLAREVQRARGQVELLSRHTVAERLDGWLAWTGGGLPDKGEWKQIAAQIAVSPEALYRELARRRKN